MHYFTNVTPVFSHNKLCVYTFHQIEGKTINMNSLMTPDSNISSNMLREFPPVLEVLEQFLVEWIEKLIQKLFCVISHLK